MTQTTTLPLKALDRLEEIAFMFQKILLGHVHDIPTDADISKTFTKDEAEQLADEIQRIYGDRVRRDIMKGRK